MSNFCGILNSPLGILTIRATNFAVYSIDFFETNEILHENDVILECKVQLHEYFNNQRTKFSVPIDISGSKFSKNVLRACQNIPYGTTTTYSAIANEIQNPHAKRAVGQALHRNSLPILIPCHRVIHKQTSNAGYAGQIWRKQILLNIEKQ